MLKNNKILFLPLILIFMSFAFISNVKCSDFVEVGGKLMHTCVKGSGETTIVLLSGWGTDNPIEDFMPLEDALSENYKVVILEYFGYGKSDITTDERGNKSFVDEIRECLHKLNIEPPYIFMPHSMSGLYTLYYVNEYPNEVAAIIGLDQSVPQKQIERWTDETFEDDKLSSETSDLNIAVINQWNMFYANSKELVDVKYDSTLPILLFLSSENVDLIADMVKSGQMKTSWIGMNENMITNTDIQFIKVLNAKHYVYHDVLEEIVADTEKFITKFYR